VLLERFRQSAKDGLGPDLMLGSKDWMGSLATAGLIRPLKDGEISYLNLDSRAIRLTEFQNNTYGVPLSVEPKALYYNKNLVDRPATTLDELLEHAAEDKQVAFVPRFEAAHWGIQAFGSGLFNEDRILNLDDSAFTDWLAWLKEAQDEPGVILNTDEDTLLELFAEGKLAYYVAGPQQQAFLKQAMGDDAFGVTRLPKGPESSAGPLLPAEIAYFYAFSSNEQARTALALARFLANPQQSTRFMRELSRVPANPQVNVDFRIYPTVSGFSRQATTAVILPNELNKEQLYGAGDRAYISALTGQQTPEEAVCRFGLEVAALQKDSGIEVILPPDCVFSEDEPASN
jgi:maltose-binding protein MalE